MDDDYTDWQDGELQVVVNHEEQYSIWPAERELPAGWRGVGKQGEKKECLEYISEVWTDMRPLSLRKQMEEMERRRPELEEEERKRLEEELQEPPDPRDDLVKFLSEGDHPVEITLRPEKTIEELKACIDRGYVHIKFTDTRGETELATRLDRDACDFLRANLEKKSAQIHIEGTLTLNYANVRCVADVDVETLVGTGHLIPGEE